MKKIILFILLAGLVSPQMFGQCRPGVEIELAKTGQRDWVKDFNALVKKYGNNEKTNRLRPFFYQDNQPKSCISLTDLQLLKSELEATFPIAAHQNDANVKNFTAAVTSIAASNPAAAQTGPFVEENVNAEKDSVSNAGIPAETLDPRTELEAAIDNGNVWMFAAMLAGLTALGLGLAMYFQTKKLKETIARQTQQLLKLGKDRHESGKGDASRELGLKAEVQKWKDKFLASDHERRQLSDEFGKFKEKTKAAFQKKGPLTTDSAATPETIAEPEKAFFLSLPTATDDGTGSFRDMRQVQPNPTSSYYKFVENADGTTAKFWFLENQNTLQSALIYPDTYINPACEYKNFNSTAKSIKTEEPGLAEKQGENWKVVRRAKIKFV